MPRGDRTGPTGKGPRTGRAAGYCSGSSVPGYANSPGRGGMRGPGRGGRGGRGPGGRGWRNMFYATGLTGWQRAMADQPEPEPPGAAPERHVDEELALLRAQAEETAAALNQIQQRIEEIAASQLREGDSDSQECP